MSALDDNTKISIAAYRDRPTGWVSLVVENTEDSSPLIIFLFCNRVLAVVEMYQALSAS